jgi:hypothetical protein
MFPSIHGCDSNEKGEEKVKEQMNCWKEKREGEKEMGNERN